VIYSCGLSFSDVRASPPLCGKLVAIDDDADERKSRAFYEYGEQPGISGIATGFSPAAQPLKENPAGRTLANPCRKAGRHH
jgi:hypothetical protein